MDVGSKIKKVRELKNFTQEHMAQRLNVSQSTYSRFEKNDYDLTISQLHNIADEFGIKTEELLTFDEKTIFNNYGEIKDSQQQFGGSKIENHFPEKLQQLYEDKIKLLEEKIAWLEKR